MHIFIATYINDRFLIPIPYTKIYAINLSTLKLPAETSIFVLVILTFILGQKQEHPRQNRRDEIR